MIVCGKHRQIKLEVRAENRRRSDNAPAKVRIEATQRSSSMTTLTTPPRSSWASVRSRHSRLTFVEPSEEAIVVMPSRARTSALPEDERPSADHARLSDRAREAAPRVSHAMTGADGPKTGRRRTEDRTPIN